MLRWYVALCCVGCLCAAVPAEAQLTIQQPVVGSTSVGTTVSVPDRGRAFLGGVGRAADGRTNTGPFRSGSNVGQSRSASSMSVSVTIHDFDAMDRHLLSRPDRGSAGVPSRGDDSYRELLARNQRRGLPATPRGGESLTAKTTPTFAEVRREDSSPSETALASNWNRGEDAYRLGQQAEARGAGTVARLHYRLAAKHGSTAAKERLEALDATTTAKATDEATGRR